MGARPTSDANGRTGIALLPATARKHQSDTLALDGRRQAASCNAVVGSSLRGACLRHCTMVRTARSALMSKTLSACLLACLLACTLHNCTLVMCASSSDAFGPPAPVAGRSSADACAAGLRGWVCRQHTVTAAQNAKQGS